MTKANQTSWQQILIWCLWLCAVLLALGGPIYGAARLAAAADTQRFDAVALLGSLAWFVIGPSAACLLCAAAYMMKHLDQLQPGRPFPPAAPTAREEKADRLSPPAEGRASLDAGALERILAQLSEINTNLLMSEEERRAKSDVRRRHLVEKLTEEAHQAVASRDFAASERAADRLRDEFGEAERCEEIMRRIVEARHAAEAELFAAEVSRVEELMSVASFGQAKAAALELSAGHPDSPEIKALLERVDREAETFSAETRKRLYGEVLRAAEARQWKSALASAHRLLSEYPDSSEAEKITAKLPTIRDNSRLEEARQLRDDIRELIERRRYAEAVRIAHDILARFPDTQAAAELRPQVERLEALARGEEPDQG